MSETDKVCGVCHSRGLGCFQSPAAGVGWICCAAPNDGFGDALADMVKVVDNIQRRAKSNE